MKNITKIILLLGLLGLTSVHAETETTPSWRASKAEFLSYLSSDRRYRVQEFTHNGKSIIVAQRTFTSGVDSSWLYVFAQGRDDWFLALSWVPIGGDSFRVVQHGDRVSFTLAALKRHVMDISIRGVCTEPQKSE